nr:Spy/CpxP family protein refolding chaperone [uncultured Duganella sp.]
MTNKEICLRKLLLLAAALPLMAAAGGAGASEAGGERPPMPQGGPHGHDDGPGMRRDMPPLGFPGMGGWPPSLRGVELTDAQQDKVFAILHAQQPYLREQGRAAAKAQEALREMGDADKYDDAKAAALAQSAATAMANIALQRVRTEQKLLAVLTPEQRKLRADDNEGRDQPRRPRPPLN